MIGELHLKLDLSSLLVLRALRLVQILDQPEKLVMCRELCVRCVDSVVSDYVM